MGIIYPIFYLLKGDYRFTSYRFAYIPYLSLESFGPPCFDRLHMHSHMSYRLNLGWGALCSPGPIGDYIGFWGDLLRDILQI